MQDRSKTKAQLIAELAALRQRVAALEAAAQDGAPRPDDHPRASEAVYERLADLSPDPLAIHVDGQIVYTNAVGATLVGAAAAADLVGKRVLDFVYPDDRETFTQYVHQAAAGQPADGVEMRIVTLDGSVVTTRVTSLPLVYGSRAGVISFARDVTPHKPAEAARRAREARALAPFEEFPISLWEEDFSEVKRYLDGLRTSGITDLGAHFRAHPEAVAHCVRLVEVLDVNRATLEMLHAPDMAALREGVSVFLAAEGLDPFRDELVAFAGGSTHFSSEIAHRTLDGDKLRMALNVAIAPGYEATWSRVFVSLVDITGRVRAEEALRQSEAKLRRTFETIPNPTVIWERHPDGRITMALVNPALVALSEGKITAFLGTEAEAFFAHTPVVAEYIRQAFETGEPRRIEMPYTYRTTGKTGWVLADYARVNETYLLSIFMDITERKHIEEALQQRSRDLNLLVKAGQALTSTLELGQVLTRLIESVAGIVNAEGGSVWMWDENCDGWLVCRSAYHEGVAESLVNLSLPRGAGIVGWTAEHRRSVLVTDVQHDPRFTASIDAKTGYTTRSLIAVPLLRGERVLGVVEAVNGDFDEEDLARVEMLAATAAIAIENAQLVEQQRYSNEELRASNDELDAYAHTVAHDLKNPLGIVLGHTLLLEELCAEGQVSAVTSDPEAQETARTSLQAISRHSARMSNIIDELLLFASVRRVEDVALEPLDMTSIVIESLDRLSFLIEQHQADIVVPEIATWPAALGHAPWVEAVWTNYISNAIKYGGNPPHVELGAAVEPDGMVRFWVHDNGLGLTPEEQARLFSMFTRLDQVRARGHGLGLSIVQRIVEKLGGRVEVESEVGAGSTFSFTLPAFTPGT